MRIRLAIVEDDALFCNQAVEFVRRFEQESGDEFDVDTFPSSITFLKDFNAGYDIILLDILMPGMNGFQAAEQIRKFDQNSVIMFITSTPQYAIKGYSVNALSYILKPLSWPTFEAEFTRAVEAVKRNVRPMITLQSGATYYQVPLDEISYIESRQHRITVHTDDNDINVTSTLLAFEEKLEPRGFFRINLYYLVNMSRVKAVEGQNCILDTNAELKISRARKKGFTEALTQQLGGTLTDPEVLKEPISLP